MVSSWVLVSDCRVWFLVSRPCTTLWRSDGWRVGLGPSHIRHPSIGFWAAHQWWYKILLLRPVCGVVPPGSSILSLPPGIRNTCHVEKSWSYFWCLMLGTDQSEQKQGRSCSGLIIKHQNWLVSMRMFNFKLIQLKPFFFCWPFLHSPTLLHEYQQQNTTKSSS